MNFGINRLPKPDNAKYPGNLNGKVFTLQEGRICYDLTMGRIPVHMTFPWRYEVIGSPTVIFDSLEINFQVGNRIYYANGTIEIDDGMPRFALGDLKVKKITVEGEKPLWKEYMIPRRRDKVRDAIMSNTSYILSDLRRSTELKKRISETTTSEGRMVDSFSDAMKLLFYAD